MKYLPNSSKYKWKVPFTSMELICYDGSTLLIKLDLIKQVPFMPFLIFKCVVRSKMLLESFRKPCVGWKWRTICLEKWLFQRQMKPSLSFTPPGWSPLPSRWVSIIVVNSLWLLNSVHLFASLDFRLTCCTVTQMLPLSFAHRHLMYVFALPGLMPHFWGLSLENVCSKSLFSSPRLWWEFLPGAHSFHCCNAQGNMGCLFPALTSLCRGAGTPSSFILLHLQKQAHLVPGSWKTLCVSGMNGWWNASYQCLVS